VTSWFGIAVFLLFSVSVSLFAQLERKRFRGRELPTDLGQWVPLPSDPTAAEALGNAAEALGAGNYVERRVLLEPGGLLRRTRLIQQQRVRDAVSGEIYRVEPEVVLARWFDW
jgi:hypothetical protein